jgi:hypothetical protein
MKSASPYQGKYLVTTSNWFYGPDGKSYRAAWGTLYPQRADKILAGITPTRMTNWALQVGNGNDKTVWIAGCQIQYVMRCDKKPVLIDGVFKRTDSDMSFDKNSIWIAE